MKVVVAHNRYASGAPSGENVIVDTEIAQLSTAGVSVLPFLRSSDEIGTFSTARKVLLPLSPIRNGDSQQVFSLADAYWGRLPDGTYTNLMDANLAINCADTDPETAVSEDEIRTLATEWGQRFPLFGAGSAVGLRTCQVWEAERTPIPERDAEGAAPILVVGNAGDPVTPLPGAVDLAEDLTSGVLLTWQGQGHTSYPKTECVTAAVNAYLIDLAVPQDGLTCPA